MTGILDPDKPPCPWCLKGFALKQALWWEGHAYCPHCRRCVAKYVSQSLLPGEMSSGWYWGKHRAHQGPGGSLHGG